MQMKAQSRRESENGGQGPATSDQPNGPQARRQNQQYEIERPVSLGNLLFQRAGDADLANGDGAAKLGELDGDQPRSSSPSPSLLSPSASIHSASSYTAPTHRATKVALPLNDRGVRTRVNILSPPARAPHNAERQRPASSSSARLLSAVAGPSGEQQPRSSSDSARYASSAATSAAAVEEARRFSNLSHINQTTSVSTGHPVFNMVSAANRRIIPEHRVTPASAQEQPYTFPARPNGHMRHYAATSGPRTPEHKNASSQAPGHSSNSSSASAHPYTASGPSSGQLGKALSNTSVYSTPASSISRPSPNASISQLNKASHLQNLPCSLIPGGYDFSPASASAHESHGPNSSSTFRPDATVSVPFTYMRDRSASVPRTVSSLGESERSSSEDYHRQFPQAQTAHNDSGHGAVAAMSDISNLTFTTVRQARDSHESEDAEHSTFSMPQISPVPPKLDLDFGSFSLDFGSSFGTGSLNLGTSFSDLSLLSIEKPAFVEKPPSVRARSALPDIGSASSVVASATVQQSARPRPSDVLSLGVGFPPPRSGQIADTTRLLPVQGDTDNNTPLASLTASTLPLPETRAASALPSHSVESILELAPKAVSPLTRLARSASNSSSLTDLTTLERTDSLRALDSAEDDRTPKASSATQMTFTHPKDGTSILQGGLTSARPQLERSQSESPASASASRIEPSRPASSLLAHNSQQRLGSDRQRLDSFDRSESKRTTLSSYEQHGQGLPATAQIHKGLHPQRGEQLGVARLSINKVLPAIPGLAVHLGSNSLEPPPTFRRSSSESVISSTSSERPGQQQVRGRGSRESQHSSASTSSSIDMQPLHQLSLQQSRSRANTLDLLANGHSQHAVEHRGPHASAANSLTMHTTRMEAADMGEKAAQEQRLGARSLAKFDGRTRSKTRKYDVWPNGELMKQDSATDKLLVRCYYSMRIGRRQLMPKSTGCCCREVGRMDRLRIISSAPEVHCNAR